MRASHSLLGLALLILVPIARDEDPAADLKKHRSLLRKVERLSPAEQALLLERARGQVEATDTLHARLVSRLLSGAPALDELEAPTSPGPMDLSDHGITRKPMPPSARPWKRLKKEVDGIAPAPWPFERRVVYEMPTGRVVRVSAAEDLMPAFRNGLRGFHPDVDRAAAQLERALDEKGPFRTFSALTAHDYVDADGRSYPGISFLEVWGALPPHEEISAAEGVAMATILVAEASQGTLPGEVNPTGVSLFLGARYYDFERYRTGHRAIASCWIEGGSMLEGDAQEAALAIHGLLAEEDHDVPRMHFRLTNYYFELLNGVRGELEELGDDGAKAARNRVRALEEGREEIAKLFLDLLEQETR